MNKTRPSSPLTWRRQEIPFDHPDSRYRFRLDGSKAIVSTRNALEEFRNGEIHSALRLLQQKAIEHDGLDYLQTFEDKTGRRLWVIEDGQAITAMLPEDY